VRRTRWWASRARSCGSPGRKINSSPKVGDVPRIAWTLALNGVALSLDEDSEPLVSKPPVCGCAAYVLCRGLRTICAARDTPAPSAGDYHSAFFRWHFCRMRLPPSTTNFLRRTHRPDCSFDTTMGRLTCKLFDKEAPLTTANFIGLATGTKMDRSSDIEAVKNQPFYDGTTFHRVIPGFMIQGGDRLGTGEGDAGYYIPDEISPSLRFDVPGRLAMANSGPAPMAASSSSRRLRTLPWMENIRSLGSAIRTPY
jgi:cyclophilin family peptidyl-prolyl cis-trans isomerase